MNAIELIDSFSEFKELKNIDRVTMMRIVEDVFRSTLKRKYGSDENVDVIINPDKGDLEIWLNREIVPDKDFAINWAKDNSKNQSLESIVKDQDFKKEINEVVNKVNKDLSVIEHVRKFILIDHEFTIENSMMTPSMKVRRFVVKNKYGEELEKLY